MISVRLAKSEDAAVMLSWRNHETTRNNSLCNKVITLEEHERWLLSSIVSNLKLIGIASLNGDDVGVISFSIDKSVSEVSIYLNPKFFGKGYGTTVLRKGIDFLLLKAPQVNKLKASILDGNIASIKVFEKCGFKKRNGYYEAMI